MIRFSSKRMLLSGLLGTAFLAAIAYVGSNGLQAQIPSLPSLPGGLKAP